MACVACWLQGSLTRVFPSSPERETVPLSLTLVRGGRLSLQVGVLNSGRKAVRVAVEAAAPDGCSARVRRVGWVPMAHHNPGTDRGHLDGLDHVPGLVPDPLHLEDLAVLGPLETQAFWITLTAPVDAIAGDGALGVRVAPEGEPVRELVASVRVADVTLRADPPLPVTHWFYADALCDWYGADPFDARFWTIVRPYMRDLVEHGSTCQYVPLFTPPTDGVKRPTQPLRVVDGPLDSTRWEVFADSQQDYALLQTPGVGEDAPLLAPLEGYDRSPRDAGRVEWARRTLLCAL